MFRTRKKIIELLDNLYVSEGKSEEKERIEDRFCLMNEGEESGLYRVSQIKRYYFLRSDFIWNRFFFYKNVINVHSLRIND